MSAETVIFIKEFLWAPLIGLIGWGWHHVNKRGDDLAAELKKSEADMRVHVNDRHMQSMVYIDKRALEINVEMDRQRDNVAKIFDKLEMMQKRGEDRHLELLHALHQGLSTKADK
jgi:hypothetical protein